MDTQLQINGTLLDPNASTTLRTGLSLRSAQWADVKPVAQLILDVCTADGDPTVAVTPEELEREWKTPEFNLEKDAWVAETSDGRIVGYEEFNNRHAHASLMGDGYVHPEYMGRGVGTTMLRTLERRAREEMELAEPDLRVFIRNGMSIGDKVSREMHESEGYKPIRFSWRMEITFNEPPESVPFPEGIELRPFIKGEQDLIVWQAEQEAFRDHWGGHEIPFEHWKHRKLSREEFDPTLWMIAWNGSEIAGFSQNRYRNGIGWIGTLGVRRPWRKRGLGEALLLRSFDEFSKRGMKTVGLNVDAENPTGATRLYKKAGMQVASEYVIYEKELRPGRELEEEE